MQSFDEHPLEEEETLEKKEENEIEGEGEGFYHVLFLDRGDS